MPKEGTTKRRKMWWTIGIIGAVIVLALIGNRDAFSGGIRASLDEPNDAAGARPSATPDPCALIKTKQGSWEALEEHIPRNWLPQETFRRMSYTEHQEYASDVATAIGCSSGDAGYLESALRAYGDGRQGDGSELKEFVPATCTLPQRADFNGDYMDYIEAFDAAVLPMAAEYVQALADEGVEIARDSTDEVALSYAFLGAMGCPAHWWVEGPTSSAMLEAIVDLDPYEPLTPGTGGATGSWNGGVPNIDVDNPFWCGWSFRGGFNCGVHH